MVSIWLLCMSGVINVADASKGKARFYGVEPFLVPRSPFTFTFSEQFVDLLA